MTVNGHYTLQLRNHGNFAGEAANQPGIPSVYGNLPEVFGPALDRLMPEGRLDNYQQHKLRIYGTYAQALGRFGSLDVAPLWRVNSGGVYSLTVVDARCRRRSWRATRATRRATSARRRAQTVFFGERGEYDFKGYGVIDLATSYNVAVWKTVGRGSRSRSTTLFNNQKQIAWDRTVTRRRGQRARRQRHPDRLRARAALRSGDRRHALPASRISARTAAARCASPLACASDVALIA